MDIVCIGGAVLDRKLALHVALQLGTSNPIASTRHFGGVARNVCENLSRLGLVVALVTRVGADTAGRDLVGHLAALGVDTSRVVYDVQLPTAEYIAVLAPDGELALGLADMAVFDQMTSPAQWARIAPEWIFADCNLPANSLGVLLAEARHHTTKLAVDCVSVAKSSRLPPDLSGIDLLFANADEAAALVGARLAPEAAALAICARGAKATVLTLGASGVVVVQGTSVHHLPSAAIQVVDVTGAGDALIAATLAGLVARQPMATAVQLGLRAAALTIGVQHSVRVDLAAALNWPNHQGFRKELPHD